jgi:hypothetical protein
VDKKPDLILTCHQCGRKFIFTQAEQEFYQQKGFTQPHRCKQCRSARNPSHSPFLCSKCGSKLVDGAPIYCATCFEDVELEFEMKARKLQGKIDQADAKLSAIEAEKARLIAETDAKLSAFESEKTRLVDELEAKIGAVENEKMQLANEVSTRLSIVESERSKLEGLLSQKNQAAVEMQEQLNNVNLELEKAIKYRVALEWLGPTVQNMKEELHVLARNQESLSGIMIRLDQRIEKNHADGSLSGIFRRFLRHHPNSPAPGQ